MRTSAVCPEGRHPVIRDSTLTNNNKERPTPKAYYTAFILMHVLLRPGDTFTSPQMARLCDEASGPGNQCGFNNENASAPSSFNCEGMSLRNVTLALHIARCESCESQPLHCNVDVGVQGCVLHALATTMGSGKFALVS
jgi:hypothetical protein